MHTIEVRGVSKHFSLGHGFRQKPLHVLDRISLSISKGEFVGILGPNGCGKSTLFKLILGLEQPTNGEITILGKNPQDVRVGYVPQNASGALYPWFSSSENLHFAVNEATNGTIQLVKDRLLDFGVAAYENVYPYQLSGGLKQLVSIARATLCSNIFLLDEPLTGLDYQNRLIVEKKLLDMRNAQNTVLMVSHDIESTVLLCDKIIVLTPKPSRIKAVLPVSLPKNRSHEMRFHPDFQCIQRFVYSVLTGE